MSVMSALLWALGAYLALGALCGGAFVLRGMGRVDGAAGGAGWGVRLTLWPGAAALWPVVMVMWLGALRRGGPAPVRAARGMRALRAAHAWAWVAAAGLIGWAVVGALAARERGTQAIAESAP